MKHYSTIVTAILVFLAALVAAGTGLYYVVGFGWLSMGVGVMIAAVLTFIIHRSSSPLEKRGPEGSYPESNNSPQPSLSKRGVVVTLLILSLDIIALASLFIFRTDDAIRSPWEVVPPVYFLLFWTASALLILVADSRWKLPLSMLHTFTGWSVALLVYQLGYGFDPFIHQAAEKIIAADGVVHPLTPYYIGQYVIVVTLHRLTTIPLDVIDRWLLPTLASISIPYMLHRWSSRRKPALERGPACPAGRLTSATPTYSLAPFATILPAVPFIMTTPQGLGFLWLLITAFSLSSLRGVSETNDEAISRLPRSFQSLAMTSLFALAAAATHPIAGVPALALVVFTLPLRIRGRWRGLVQTLLLATLFVLSSLALPLALSRYHGTRDAIATTSSEPVPVWLAVRDAFILPLTPDLQDHSDWPLDFAYLIRKNLALITIGFATLGFYASWSSRRKPALGPNADLPVRQAGLRPLLQDYAPHLLTAASLSVSYLLVTTRLTFSGLINYEANIFPQRLREAAAIVLLPLAVTGIGWIFDHARRDRWTRIAFASLTASALTASIYLSYPRVDRYEKNSGRSVSAAMIEAVHWVENDRDGRPAIVLADQNAAAVQIHDFGFGPYYPVSPPRNGGEVEGGSTISPNYFYSHPSGGLDLYRYFQLIVEGLQSPHATARAAADFAGVQNVYLIIPSYWKTFAPVVTAAKKESTEWTSLHDGDVYVFKFLK